MKYILTSVLVALWFISPALAEVFCFDDDAKDVEKNIQSYNEEFVFSGVTASGTPITVYKGKDTFTILFLTNEGKVCTGPNYTGHIIPKLKLNNKKGI
jgi:hypothetical protein